MIYSKSLDLWLFIVFLNTWVSTLHNFLPLYSVWWKLLKASEKRRCIKINILQERRICIYLKAQTYFFNYFLMFFFTFHFYYTININTWMLQGSCYKISMFRMNIKLHFWCIFSYLFTKKKFQSKNIKRFTLSL